MTDMKSDLAYKEYPIERVTEEKDGWELMHNGHWCVFLFRKHRKKFNPKVGDTLGLCSDSWGIRGLSINGKVAFYRTREEQKLHDQKEMEKEGAIQRNKFRNNNPDFRWKYETYEMFCCKEAVKIARALKTPTAIQKFQDNPRKHLELVSKEHSGNTFGMSCYLAYLYLTNPKGVVELHGALASLVGSEEYGCILGE